MTEFEEKLLRTIELHLREQMVQSSMLVEIASLFKMYLKSSDNFDYTQRDDYAVELESLADTIRDDECNEIELWPKAQQDDRN